MANTIPTAPTGNITSVLQENRVFRPSKEFSKRAHVSSMAAYRKLYHESIRQPEKFWARRAKEELVWFKPWKKVLQWKLPNAKWFSGGLLNVSVNCLDRHLDTPTANKAALIWEGEPAGPGKPGEERTLTYQQLHREVCLFANVLKRHGIQKGDRIIIYLPMVPEAAIAMLACARIGAIHSVVFGGFSAQSVADRIFDCQAKLVITADGGHRRGAIVALKKHVDDALVLRDASGHLLAQSIEKVIVLRRTNHEINIQEGRDVWWHRELQYVDADCPPEKLESETPLFILYTSGSTGKPKGILHTTAGYLLGAKMTTRLVFDLRPEDVCYESTADVGWSQATATSFMVPSPTARPVSWHGMASERSRARPLLAHSREIWRQRPLHQPHSHPPAFDEMGRRLAQKARPLQPAPPRHGRRADQSRSLDVVLIIASSGASGALLLTHGGKRKPAAL